MEFSFRHVVILSSVLVLGGCGTSSPRFKSSETSAQSKLTNSQKQAHRFSSKHVEEEIAEDDHKVDARSVATSHTPTNKPNSDATKKKTSQGAAGQATINTDAMMDVILGYLGTPYQWGGTTKSGIDCSAFSGAVYEQSTSISLPRTTDQQVKMGHSVITSELKFGDLLFFNTTGVNPSHVGIYIGDDLFAHASEAFGVTISSLQSSYYRKRFTDAKRILE